MSKLYVRTRYVLRRFGPKYFVKNEFTYSDMICHYNYFITSTFAVRAHFICRHARIMSRPYKNCIKIANVYPF